MFGFLRKVGPFSIVLSVILVLACLGGGLGLGTHFQGGGSGVVVSLPGVQSERSLGLGLPSVEAQQGGASIATFPHHFVPSEPGAGVDIECGGEYPGLRGTYLCSISQVGNDITITYQTVDTTVDRGVSTDTHSFSLAGGQADGVVTSGAFSANNENLVLTVTAGGTDTTVTVPVPAAIRAGASLSDADPEDVAITGAEEGTSTDVSRADHVHAGDRQRAFGTHAPDLITSGAGDAGTNTTVSRSDHQHGGQRTFATTNPSNVTTGTSSVGTSGNLSRADHVHGGDTDTTLSFATGTPAPVAVGTGTVGVLGTTSRSDHVHGGDRQRTLSDTDPLDVARLATEGTSTEVSRQDHVHAGRAPLHVANAAATQTAQSFLFTVTPAMSNTPPVGSTIVWKTPATVAAVANDPDVNIQVTGGPNGAMIQPGGDGVAVSQLIDNAAYINVWDGTAWQIPDKVVTGSAATLSDDDPEDVGLAIAAAGTDTDASRSDHVHTLTTGQRLPTGATDGQVVTWQTSSSTWIAATIAGGGVQSFLTLSDTPGAYTGQASRLTRVNAAESAIEFVDAPAPSHQILNVGSLPDPTVAGSPDLVYLTHEYTEGTKQDVTVTVGIDTPYAGYSDGNYLQDAFGSVSGTSPVNALFGTGTGTDYTIQSLLSFNRAWLDEFTHIEIAGVEYTLLPSFPSLGAFERRIQAEPTGLSAATLTLNFKRADNSWYFTNGDTVRHEAGLYEKVGNPPAYHDLAPIEDTHRDGHGSDACGPDEPPTDGAQVCIDDDGRAYFSTDRLIFVTTPAEITAMDEFQSDYWRETQSLLDLNELGNDGYFVYHPPSDSFIQLKGTRSMGTLTVTGTDTTVIPRGTLFNQGGSTNQFRTTADATISGTTVDVNVERTEVGGGGNIAANENFSPVGNPPGITSATNAAAFTGGSGNGLEVETWVSIWTYIASIDDSDTPQHQARHDELSTMSVFLGEFAQTQDAADDRDSYTSATDRYFYIIFGDEDEIQEITGFTHAVETEQPEEHEWTGPVVTIEDVQDVYEANSTEEVTLGLDNLRIGDRIYSVLARIDEDVTGGLRDPNSGDWNSVDGVSRTLAFDGNELYRVIRYLEIGHDAAGTFTAIPSGTNFGQYRWRGSHHNDVDISNPVVGDFYLHLGNNLLRLYVADSVNGNFWGDTVGTHDLHTQLDYQGAFNSQADALANAGDNDDDFRVAIRQSNQTYYTLYFVSDFTPAEAQHYRYEWQSIAGGLLDGELFFAGPDPASGVLRQAESRDFNAATGRSATLGFDGDKLNLAARRLVPAHTATATFTDVGEETTLPGTGYRWRGTHWQDYLITNPAEDDVYLKRDTYLYRRYDGSAWHDISPVTVFSGLNYLGEFATQADGLAHVTGNGQYLAVPTGTRTYLTLAITSGFTAGLPAHYEYYWKPLIDLPDVPPVTFPATQDQILRWSTTTARYEPSQITTGATIDGIGTSGDPLVVNVNEVTENVQETIVHFTEDFPLTFTNRGSTVGEVYGTGPYSTAITRVRFYINSPVATNSYTARLYRLNADNNNIAEHLANSNSMTVHGTAEHYFDFAEGGIEMPVDSRIAVVISRTDSGNDAATMIRFGAEATGSPHITYDDATIDFDREGWVQYLSPNPGVGQDTHAHGDATIHGNIKIQYRRTFNHGHLVGTGNVDLAHLDSDVVDRLLPASPTDDQIAQYDAATSAWEAVTFTGGNGSSTFTGLTDTPSTITANQCLFGNAGATALIFDTCSNTDGDITAVLAGTGITVTSGDSGDATVSVTQPLPDSPTDGQVPVWNANTSAWEADDRTSTGTVDGVVLVDDVTYGWQTANGPSQEVHFSRALALADDELLLHIDWREWATTDPGENYRDAGASVFAQYVRALTDLPPLSLNKVDGGRTAIDRGDAITEANVQGAVTFKFPQHTAGHPLADMRLIYIGDHHDDTNESVDRTETEIDVDNTEGFVAGRNYWMVGPVAGCAADTTYHSEKVEFVSVATPGNPGSINVTRNIDSTELPSNNCSFSSGADLIDDNKRYFTLVNSDADQDNAAFSVTLLPSGGGTGGGAAFTTGNAFPASPDGDDLFGFNAAATGLTDTVDYDGTTPITEAIRGDTFKYDSTDSEWVKQFSGDTILSEEQVEDFVGEMVSGNTETGIAVTYQDTDGTLDFDVQTAGDARYAQLASNNTFTGDQTITTTSNSQALTINANGVDGSSVFRVNVPTTGGQQAFQTGRVGQTLAWASFDGNLGGTGENPGIAFGSGTGGRDVNIYRGGANILKTDDAFEARSLDVETAGATETRTNLGIVDYSTGTAFPASPIDGDIFEFNDSASSLTNTFDYDGTTALTSASRGDVFKYDRVNTRWVRQSSEEGASAFTGLSDTPATITANECVVGNAAGTELEFSTCGTGGAVQGFAQEDQQEQWGIDEYVRQQVFGNQRVARHFTVAPTGENEAIKYRDSFQILPVFHNGQTLDVNPHRMVGLTSGAVSEYPELEWRVQGFLSVLMADDVNTLEISSLDGIVVGSIINVHGGGGNQSEFMQVTAIDGPTTASFSGGGGSGASANVVISGGAVVGFIITDGGSGYTTAPTVTINGPGTGATATATITSGAVTSIAVDTAGTGYRNILTVVRGPAYTAQTPDFTEPNTAREHAAGVEIFLLLRHYPERIPTYLHELDDPAFWTQWRASFDGNDVPYFTFNPDLQGGQLNDWRSIVGFIQLKRADGQVRTYEALVPFGADMIIAADQVLGDPYTIREIGMRRWLGLPTGNPQQTPGSRTDQDQRTAAFPRGPQRTHQQDLLEWTYSTDDYNIERLRDGGMEYTGDELDRSQFSTLSADITATDTVFSLGTVTGIAVGDELIFITALTSERTVVNAVDTVNNQVTVTRFDGATAHSTGTNAWRFPGKNTLDKYLIDVTIALAYVGDPRLDVEQMGVYDSHYRPYTDDLTAVANPSGVTSENTRLDSITIGGVDYNTAHVVLPSQSAGSLRAPVASDWDTTNGISRILAFDGVDLYRVARRLTGAHSASATFTEVTRDTVIDGNIDEDCTWKGVHWTDSLADSSPTEDDCYFNLRENTFRWYYTNGWFDVTSYVVFRGLIYKGEHSTRDEALAAVNGNSEYVIYTDTNGDHNLYLTSDYVAADAGDYVYEWKDANAGLAPDVNEVVQLHTSATVTEDADDWVAFTLSQVPQQDSDIELQMSGASARTVFRLSAGAWFGLTEIPAAQVTDSDGNDPLSNSTAVTFPIYSATTIAGFDPTEANGVCAVARQTNTSLLIGCSDTGAMNFGLEIVEIP